MPQLGYRLTSAASSCGVLRNDRWGVLKQTWRVATSIDQHNDSVAIQFYLIKRQVLFHLPSCRHLANVTHFKFQTQAKVRQYSKFQHCIEFHIHVLTGKKAGFTLPALCHPPYPDVVMSKGFLMSNYSCYHAQGIPYVKLLF